MRELKFRAWSEETKSFECFDLYEGTECGLTNLQIWARDTQIEQYTGLKDKNGKEVYEGDILDDGEGHIGEVLYNERLASFAYEWGNCGSTFMSLYTSDMKIIGNIHESADLLEEKE